jgi:predicted nucleotidyltransferase
MSTLLTLTKLASEANLPFLVVGGNAVIAHGYQRGTKDVDLLVQEVDLSKWAELLAGMGYVTQYTSGAFQQYVFPEHKYAPVDLIIVSVETFARMTAAPATVSLEGAEFKVPRLSHLFALKLHAMRQNPSKRYERDLGDIVALMQMHGISLEMEEYAAIFERYATGDIRREVERRLAGPGSSGGEH